MNDWKIIGNLTDEIVLGTGGISTMPPQRKVRAILINGKGKYAVINEQKSKLHALPGGGMEMDEEPVGAIVREVFEETGCSCDIIEPLGIVYENRYHSNCTRMTYFFVIHTNSAAAKPQFTDEETALGTSVMWCTFDELLRFIQDIQHDTMQKKFIQARDVAALNAYIQSHLHL